VVAIPEAAAPWFRPVDKPLATAPYFLFVGTLEPRKNLNEIVGAWRALRLEHNADLVIVGRRREDGPRIEPEPGLRILGELQDEELPALYSGATAFLYPSLYEGFGLPVLEAMQCGACVIASGALSETGGDAAAYAASPGEWTRLMARALDDAAWRTEMRARSLEQAARFSWEETARQTREVYKEACARFGL
jgi:glycosyltransferase involved in cell wall biosynthesis